MLKALQITPLKSTDLDQTVTSDRKSPVTAQDPAEMEEFNLFRDYFGLINLVKSFIAKEQINYDQRERRDSLGTAGSELSSSNSADSSSSRPLPSSVLHVPKCTHRRRPTRKLCVFCRKNGEREAFYRSHCLKDGSGRVTCPVLQAYICPICGSHGDSAHTIKYCPEYFLVKKSLAMCSSHIGHNICRPVRQDRGRPRQRWWEE